MLKPKDKKRFYAKVTQGGPDDCWNWAAGRNSKGYGKFQLNKKTYYAHRVAYFLATGKRPGDRCIIHSCDNPGCCNPAHLRLGTHADNVRDRVERGRGGDQSGENNPAVKLTEKEVLEILNQLKRPYRGQLRDLAKKYQVASQTIYSIKAKQSWTHLQPS